MKAIKMNRSQQSGFTLIELIAVIVILGILAAMAIPTVTDFRADAQNAADSYEAKASSNKAAVNAWKSGAMN